jgi:hypothetical protein
MAAILHVVRISFNPQAVADDGVDNRGVVLSPRADSLAHPLPPVAFVSRASLSSFRKM